MVEVLVEVAGTQMPIAEAQMVAMMICRQQRLVLVVPRMPSFGELQTLRVVL